MERKIVKMLVESFPTKYPEGFLSSEMKMLCEQVKEDYNKFCGKLGVNTCSVRDGEIVTYHCDVESALFLTIIDGEATALEWD